MEANWPEHALRWRQRDPHWAPPGGESLAELRDRIRHTVDELASAHVGQQIVLVAHGGVLDVLYRLATGQAIQAPRSWQLGNATINRLLWTPEGLSLVGWSDASHLESEPLLDESSD
jgi:probable phosphoglycerate mutase